MKCDCELKIIWNSEKGVHKKRKEKKFVTSIDLH